MEKQKLKAKDGYVFRTYQIPLEIDKAIHETGDRDLRNYGDLIELALRQYFNIPRK